MRQKVRRGELFLNIAVGYVNVPRDRIVKDPVRRVQEAIGLVFRRFLEFQSVRQVHLWLRQEEVLLPAVAVNGESRRIVWKPPVYNTIHHLLTNPVYGGAYAFGRTGSRVTVEDGRKRVSRGHRRDREAWDVLIVDHHEGYVSWEEFERNQRLIADNANCKGLMARGAVRRGDALLAGLLSPLGIEASVEAVAMRDNDVAETRRQVELALTQARYEADLARRQYDAVDPQNRLVASELERRWNDRLSEVARQEERLSPMLDVHPDALSCEEKERLLALGSDLETVWSHPGATAQTRKRILRAVLEEIVATSTEERIELLLHWRGGDHARLNVPRNRTGQHRWRTSTEVGDLIRGLARQQPDSAIAATLNRLGKRTGRGNPWTDARVRSFRNDHAVAVYRPGEMRGRGELTLKETADRLDVSTMTVLRLINAETITARQVCKGAPWAVPEAQFTGLDGTVVVSECPRTGKADQKKPDFQ